MGLAFITEGAIPFAASDPLHVLPSCIIGSALAGALSMAFHCTLMAPHGGIFVFPVVGKRTDVSGGTGGRYGRIRTAVGCIEGKETTSKSEALKERFCECGC